jgi:uncharacterized membrane protein YeaQ/YmgE (transglycosylase-associated protein family)
MAGVLMNGIFWILAGGMTGWLTGKLLGEKGYGIPLGGYAKSLDFFFGVVGASIGGYLFFPIVIGEGGSLSTYGTSILGSITLVGACRLISGRYFRSLSYKGMSHAAFIEWHDSLVVKELATWHPRRPENSTTATEHCRP